MRPYGRGGDPDSVSLEEDLHLGLVLDRNQKFCFIHMCVCVFSVFLGVLLFFNNMICVTAMEFVDV